jgi:hypothetical protein
MVELFPIQPQTEHNTSQKTSTHLNLPQLLDPSGSVYNLIAHSLKFSHRLKMADSNGLTSTDPTTEPTSEIPVSGKGKGKAVDETPIADASMGEDDDSSDEESTVEEAVSIPLLWSELI